LGNGRSRRVAAREGGRVCVVRCRMAAVCGVKAAESAGSAAEEGGTAGPARVECGEPGREGGRDGGPVTVWELSGDTAGVAMAVNMWAMSRRLLMD